MDTLVRIHTLPGGRVPTRKTDGAIGYDVSLRAIVCAKEMDVENPRLRKTLFDFVNMPSDPEVARYVVEKEGKLFYRMDPGESALGGIGFITEMEFPLCYSVEQRSGLSSRFGIIIANAHTFVDPDYRGEAGVVIENRSRVPFDLWHGMRIAQIIFQNALIPKIVRVESVDDLTTSRRG